VGAYRVRGQHLRLIALQYARNIIRGGTGIIFTLVLMVVCLSIAAVFVTPLEVEYKRVELRFEAHGGNPPSKEAVVNAITREIGIPVAEWATDHDSEQAEYLVRTKPALISGILMILLIAMPFLVCLGSFNQLAGDIQYKGLRYLLLRTERANLFFGRFIGTILFTIAILAILFLVLFLYLALKARFYPVGEVGLWLLQGFVALVLFSLPYIALCSWISASMSSPFISLIICELLAMSVPILVFMLVQTEKNLKYVGYVMPWPLKYQLLHPNPLHVLGAMVAMLGFTGLFLWLGVRSFQTRDL
jgi:ABC-type transport system involved in multi-copper enzyme maturation permease subunit